MIGKGRLEAFSDGVIAIIITIMVLELKAPHAESLAALLPLVPAMLAYVLSFVYVGIYWNNHHHLLHAAARISGAVLWANLHLLFWLSLIPFVTSWMGESHLGSWPVAAYGVVLLMCGIAWMLLVRTLIACNGEESALASEVRTGRGRWKERASVLLYGVGILLALLGRLGAGAATAGGEHGDVPHTPLWAGAAGCAVYGLVAAIWFIPDRRIERAIGSSHRASANG